MKKLLLLAVVLTGLSLRLYGAGHNLALARVFHPDTPKQVMFLRHYMEGDYRVRFRMKEHGYHAYPTFHVHIAEWTYRGIRGLAAMTGYPGWKFTGLQEWFFMRVMTVLFSTGTIIFVYLAGKTLFTEKAGLIAAGLFAVHPFSVGASHWIMGDNAMTFFALGAFYFFALCFKKQSMALYLLGGLFLGFAAASKYNGFVMLPAGIFPLLLHRNRRTINCFLALFFGTVLGFTIGNPSMFTHFSEGIRGTLQGMGDISRARWDASQPRMLVAVQKMCSNAGMFVNLFGAGPAVIAAISMIWMFCRKNLKDYFMAAFIPAYFLLSVIAKPTIVPIHMLPMVPLSALVIGRFLADAGTRKKAAGASLAALTAVLVIWQGYASYRESFLFIAGDTRISAEEWIEQNIPPHFAIGTSRYSARNPHSGADIRENAGRFFASSEIVGMPYPEGGEPVKNFSLEDGTAPVRFRNPDIKILAYPGKELKKDFTLPAFNRSPGLAPPRAPVYAGGIDFGIDPLKFEISPGGRFLLVSETPVEKVLVSATNFGIQTEVSAGVSTKTQKVALAPFESALLEFERPLRRAPFDRHLYSLSFSAPERVFVRVAVTPFEKGMLYFDRGDFERAAEYFGKAGGRLHPAEIDILRAFSHAKAGNREKAAEIAGGISCRAKQYAHGAPGTAKEGFRKMHLAETGISVDYLESVNTVRFGAEMFSSLYGKTVKTGVMDKEETLFHVIECDEGGKDRIHGPYMPLSAGNYFARFAFTAARLATGTALEFDVASDMGGKILSAARFEIEGGEPPEDVVLPFRVEKEAEFLEFRIALEGRGELKLYYVEVYPDFEQNLIDKAKMLKYAESINNSGQE